MVDRAADTMSQVDRTPASVLKKMAENQDTYPKDDCQECGAVIRIGFFFDGFGRNRDADSQHPTFFSNICRLWEAHYIQTDRDRPQNQFWFRFYYSGLGTELNEDAQQDDMIYAATVAGTKMLSEGAKNLTSAGKNIARLDEIPEHDALKRLRSATQKMIKEGSFQPMVKAYKDVVKDVKTLPDKVVRIWNAWDPERMANRAKGTVRGFWSGFKKNPLKVAWTAGKEVVKATALEGVPVIRDNETVAYLMGTGVDVRVDAALRQLKAAHEAVSAEMNKVRRIEITVFGADRGGVMARQFINDVVKKYRRRHDKDLAIRGEKGAPDTEIRIRFLGLFDSVSSIMDENTFLGFLPFTDLLKQTYKDRTLTVPGAVEKCIHFAAAHELRANQRLDSLEKTRGEQYLYPGSSGDVTGVSPEGSLGARTELSRVPLRDMLNHALANGAALYSMEQLERRRPLIATKFSMAAQVKDGSQSYYATELVEAYRDVVKYEPGIDFMPHMEVFLRWLAVRYQDPVFKSELSDPAEKWIKDRDFFTPEQEYNEELRRVSGMSREERAKPENTARLKELEALKDERWERAAASRGELPPKRFKPLWQRLEEEYRALEDAERKDAENERRKDELRRTNPELVRRIEQVNQGPRDMQKMRNDIIVRNGGKLTDEDQPKDPFADMKARRATEQRLLNVWREASAGKNPLPPKVMALFDFLVHDAMLSSWPDHLLASTTLYFRTRDKDIFGKTDFKAEEAKLKTDTAAAARVDQMRANLDSMAPARPSTTRWQRGIEMRLGWILALVLAAGIAGCGGEPTYRGINFIVYNYTPWDLDQVRVTDASGRSAVTGAIGVGGGEGSVSCCYTLKGTEFKVTWRGADAEEARRHMFDGELDEVIFEKTAPVHFPVSEIPAGEGPLYLELHIYPDEHMELALSRKLLGQTRIPIVAVTRWLYTEHRDALANYGSSSEVRRVLGKVAGTAWKKYRIEAEVDMRQYMRLYFTVASDFDTDPEIAALLSQPGRQPGDFAKAVAALPVATIARLKAQGTPPGDKNG